MKRRMGSSVAVVTAGALLVGSCAQTQGLLKTSDDDPCNLLVGAAIGAIGGALLDPDKRGRGALLGAAAGAVACVAINAFSRQTRTAQQVEDEYRQAHSGRLPSSEPVVQAYSVNLNPGTNVQSGEKLQLVSNMTVVRGASQPVNEIKEVMTLTAPDGNTRTAEKKANEQPGSGAYENTFNLTLPKGVAPGAYPVKTQLIVNGKPMAERNKELRVVAQAGEMRVALVEVGAD